MTHGWAMSPAITISNSRPVVRGRTTFNNVYPQPCSGFTSEKTFVETDA